MPCGGGGTDEGGGGEGGGGVGVVKEVGGWLGGGVTPATRSCGFPPPAEVSTHFVEHEGRNQWLRFFLLYTVTKPSKTQ